MQEVRSKLFKVDSIVLKTSKVGEADKIVVFFTPSRGKIHAIAKGARKPKSKFGGRLEPFSYNNVMLAKGKQLDVLSQIETIETFYDLRVDQEKLLTGIYFVRLVDASTEVGQKNEALFDLLLFSLKFLLESNKPEVARKMFEVGLINVEGFFPVLDRCVKCQKKVKKEPEKVKFNISLRGIVCSQCSQKIGGIEVPWRIIQTILLLKHRDNVELENIDISKPDIDKMDLILKTYISDHIGKDIRNW